MPYRDARPSLEARREERDAELVEMQAWLSRLAAPRRLFFAVLSAAILAAGVTAWLVVQQQGDAWTEQYAGTPIPAPSTPDLVLRWAWGGGLADECYVWSIYSDHHLEIQYGCGPKAPTTTVTIPSEAAERLLALASTVGSYSEHDGGDRRANDGFGSDLTLYGHGTRAATKQEREEIRALARAAQPPEPEGGW